MDILVMSGDDIVAEVRDNRIKILNKEKAPLDLINGKNVEVWISERAIDGSRTHGRILKKTHGLSSFASDFDTAIKYHAAVITDNYWCKGIDEKIEYADIVFTDDKYFLMAISQDDSILGEKSSRTPELTNIGSLEKGWKMETDGWWLYKNETESEMLFELVTSLIGKEIDFSMATYELKDGFIRTKDFTEQKYNLHHANSIMRDHTDNGQFVSEEDWLYNYNEFLKIDETAAKSYLNILYLDAICNNVDRHTKNYGILTDRETGDYIGLAPNYDNNMSFYGFDNKNGKASHKLAKDFKEFITINKIQYKLPYVTEEKIEKAIDRISNFSSGADYTENNINQVDNGIKSSITRSEYKEKIISYVMENVKIIND